MKKPFVSVIINDTEQGVLVQFTGASLDKVKNAYPNTIFEIVLNASSYQLPVNALNLAPQTKHVIVGMTKIAGQVKEQLDQSANNAGLRPISQAVDFKVSVTSDEATVEVDEFGGTYMIRTIVFDGNRSGEYMTAILYDPATRALSFVPAVIATRSDGKTAMSIKTPHNSIYTLVESGRRTFSDIQSHWAKTNIELLTSKLIVSGVSTAQFAPDIAITRAEFTALLVRALGLKLEPKERNLPFNDIAQNDWYAPVVEAGVQVGLVRGVSVGTFAPNVPITREQMAVIFNNALVYLGYPQLNVNDASVALGKYRDRTDISAWAQSAVAQSIAAGIIHGMTDDTIAPSQPATRAQAVVMLQRFLQYVEFID
ncbi:S-layer homology domain-containing protein [Paenibacillus koleovorans]|uniref:S-layer homology domain-containing protein n=1 Tax=Paenibacillus koleovorans TaxID=121608 RepID=UPI000FDA2193|nr:S-layer homology domain-containing protein [Paenibacillus koleovorans]